MKYPGRWFIKFNISQEVISTIDNKKCKQNQQLYELQWKLFIYKYNVFYFENLRHDVQNLINSVVVLFPLLFDGWFLCVGRPWYYKTRVENMRAFYHDNKIQKKSKSFVCISKIELESVYFSYVKSFGIWLQSKMFWENNKMNLFVKTKV